MANGADAVALVLPAAAEPDNPLEPRTATERKRLGKILAMMGVFDADVMPEVSALVLFRMRNTTEFNGAIASAVRAAVFDDAMPGIASAATFEVKH